MKKCSRCDLARDKENSRYCHECRKKYKRDRVAKYWNTLRRYKTIKGCSSCGYRKCGAALQFNHIDPTTKEHHEGLNRLIKRLVPWQRIKEEVAKCEVLCANCHAELSYEQQHHLLGAVDARTE